MNGKNRSALEVILFSVITCGIYYLYWQYIFADELKTYLKRNDINPGIDLLLCIVCFPYSIYWMYKYGKLLMEAQQKAGIYAEDGTVLLVVLSVFGLGIVDAAIMQTEINKIWNQ